MGKIICAICKEIINDKHRVDVFARYLGQMRILENYHSDCWEELVKLNRQSLSNTHSLRKPYDKYGLNPKRVNTKCY